MISYSSGPLLGDVESGAVATVFTPRLSLLSGGIFSVAGVFLLALTLPAFRHYDDRKRQGDWRDRRFASRLLYRLFE